jgi:hypothetical protein
MYASLLVGSDFGKCLKYVRAYLFGRGTYFSVCTEWTFWMKVALLWTSVCTKLLFYLRFSIFLINNNILSNKKKM